MGSLQVIRVRSVCLLVAGALAASGGCASNRIRGGASDRDTLLVLRTYLSGSFSSEAQSLRDPSYYHIVLHMTPIWTWRDDGPWMYVEQAVAQSSDRPYRQRVYRLEHTDDGRLRSRVYTFPDAAAHAGAWKSGSPLSELAPDDLEERVGCAITLDWDERALTFAGATTGTGCASELNGAAYATSEVTLEPDRLLTWDRGYDATGQQVWGATIGGYEFVRDGE